MIEKFYLKEYLSFSEVALTLKDGLNLFTGVSGSGKSILMRSILASFGLESVEAAISESTVLNYSNSEYIFNEEKFNIFKQVKKEKTRYFINNQSVSKKLIYQESSKFLRHLNTKDFSDFEAPNLLKMIDEFTSIEVFDHQEILSEYKVTFKEYKNVLNRLNALIEEEKRVVELKEFAAFEIKKIESIAPLIGEDEELQDIKKSLSQKEKLEKKIVIAQDIFNFEHYVQEALGLIDTESSFFDDTMNELRAIFDRSLEKLSDLEGIDVENILDRIEALSSLKKRYGSIEESLEYLAKKREELARYESIDTAKNELEKSKELLYKKLNLLSIKISHSRKIVLNKIVSKLNSYGEDLYLENISLELKEVSLDVLGKDSVIVEFNSTSFKNISSGEFNRLRLAFLALKTEIMSKHGGILMLDEIDANLSGEESMGVAKVLKVLAKKFQIFAISHQPQLSSMADNHYLVYKDNNKSGVRLLKKKDRIQEIARMISAGDITKEALVYASKLLEV